MYPSWEHTGFHSHDPRLSDLSRESDVVLKKGDNPSQLQSVTRKRLTGLPVKSPPSAPQSTKLHIALGKQALSSATQLGFLLPCLVTFVL